MIIRGVPSPILLFLPNGDTGYFVWGGGGGGGGGGVGGDRVMFCLVMFCFWYLCSVFVLFSILVVFPFNFSLCVSLAYVCVRSFSYVVVACVGNWVCVPC